MSSAWYEVAAEARGDAAWELYHENAKRSPDDGIPPRKRGLSPLLDYGDLEARPLVPAPMPATLPEHVDGSIALPVLAALLHRDERAGAPDPLHLFVAVRAVEALPECLGWYDSREHALRIIRDGPVGRVIDSALVSPAIRERAAALVFIAADFNRATAAVGERGYRDALIETGRRLCAIEAAAVPAGLTVESVAFYDREVDSLLLLDGLSQGVVATVAILAKSG